MDQIKTGMFLRQLRREHGWTQEAFAEKLGISEKTVSKWETGRGMPEVSFMLPVCELLGITVNELLSGERLEGEQYRRRAEEQLLDLACDRTDPRTKVIVGNMACAAVFVVCVTLILLAALCDLPVWARIVLIVCAVLAVAAVLASLLLVAVNTEIFLCPKCGKRFVPRLSAYIKGPHTMKKRRLKCPYCGTTGWCESRLRSAKDGEPSNRI